MTWNWFQLWLFGLGGTNVIFLQLDGEAVGGLKIKRTVILVGLSRGKTPEVSINIEKRKKIKAKTNEGNQW